MLILLLCSVLSLPCSPRPLVPLTPATSQSTWQPVVRAHLRMLRQDGDPRLKPSGKGCASRA